jgi:hypothetical protein
MMGEDECLDRLARIFGLGRVDDPLRLALIGRGIDHEETVLHVDDQIVGSATLDHLDIGSKLDQLEAAAGREVDRVAVGETAEEEASRSRMRARSSSTTWKSSE